MNELKLAKRSGDIPRGKILLSIALGSFVLLTGCENSSTLNFCTEPKLIETGDTASELVDEAAGPIDGFQTPEGADVISDAIGDVTAGKFFQACYNYDETQWKVVIGDQITGDGNITGNTRVVRATVE